MSSSPFFIKFKAEFEMSVANGAFGFTVISVRIITPKYNKSSQNKLKCCIWFFQHHEWVMNGQKNKHDEESEIRPSWSSGDRQEYTLSMYTCNHEAPIIVLWLISTYAAVCTFYCTLVFSYLAPNGSLWWSTRQLLLMYLNPAAASASYL